MNRTISAIIAGAALLAAAQPAAAAWGCRYEAPREAAIDAGGIAAVEVLAGAGSLTIVGVAGSQDIEATGTACATDKDMLEDVELSLERDGDTVRIEAGVAGDPDSRGSDWGALDLELRIPAHVQLDVRDSSGNIVIRDVASARIEDSSGNIEVEKVRGPLFISDSSGGIDVVDVAGDVRVVDSSGGIEIRRVDGSVVIEQDSSGDIDVTDVRDDVIVVSDSSGSISVRDVGGDFTVERDSSGAIDHRGVAGTVTVPEWKRTDREQ